MERSENPRCRVTTTNHDALKDHEVQGLLFRLIDPYKCNTTERKAANSFITDSDIMTCEKQIPRLFKQCNELSEQGEKGSWTIREGLTTGKMAKGVLKFLEYLDMLEVSPQVCHLSTAIHMSHS
jgi:hypothetical protein